MFMRRGRGERKARVRMEVGENRERLKKLKGIGRNWKKIEEGGCRSAPPYVLLHPPLPSPSPYKNKEVAFTPPLFSLSSHIRPSARKNSPIFFTSSSYLPSGVSAFFSSLLLLGISCFRLAATFSFAELTPPG